MTGRCQGTCMDEDGDGCTCAPAFYDRELDRIHATRRSLSRMDGRDDPLNDRLDRIAQQANSRGRE